jgi:hypothetical protein
MKNTAIIICFLLFGMTTINLKADPQNDARIEVCQKVDIAQIASILGWNESQIDTEALTSSSTQNSGACKYVFGDEDLVIIVKEKVKKENSLETVRSFGTVDGSGAEGSDKVTYEMKNSNGKYDIELNYGTNKNFQDADKLLENITKLVQKL